MTDVSGYGEAVMQSSIPAQLLNLLSEEALRWKIVKVFKYLTRHSPLLIRYMLCELRPDISQCCLFFVIDRLYTEKAIHTQRERIVLTSILFTYFFFFFACSAFVCDAMQGTSAAEPGGHLLRDAGQLQVLRPRAKRRVHVCRTFLQFRVRAGHLQHAAGSLCSPLMTLTITYRILSLYFNLLAAEHPHHRRN